MSSQTQFGQMADSDFANLFEALAATPKGRDFLAEYRRRSRPEELEGLLQSLQRIERTVAVLRDQLQPERIADELRHIAMTLEFAAEGAVADPDGDEAARRMALVNQARSELSVLAESLAGELAPLLQDLDLLAGGAAGGADEPETRENDLAFLTQLGEAEAPADR